MATIVWAENIKTKELIEWDKYEFFTFTATRFVQYAGRKDIEIFVNHNGALRDTYWFSPENNRWWRCNWDCHLPKEIQMHILCGALTWPPTT